MAHLKVSFRKMTDIKIVEKQYEIMDNNQVTFMLIKFEGSFLLWIGEAGPGAKLEDLSLAIANNSTSILAASMDEFSSGLASKLSIKYNAGRPVYVSYNYPKITIDQEQFIISINEKIVQFLNETLINQ